MHFDVSPGRVLAGKFEVERVIGQGGMGMVVAARHLQLDERVAIKFLLPEAVTTPEVVARFVREARAAVRIKSEHVARVSDVGTLEGGEPYMVMEYLEGSDLAAWVQRQGALPVEQAVEFVLQASEAIAEAHALGMVHRDLKPANLFVVRRADGLWSVKVLDFGISKVAPAGAASDANLTRTAAVMGSPLYMPPEQMAASRNVDARSDIWALGVILYELLSATPPFSGETLPEVCMKIATEPPPPLAASRPGIPAELEAVILRCLEKDREKRYPNIAELALALSDFAPRRSRTSVERVLRTVQAAGLSVSALALPPSSDKDAPAPAVTAGTGTEAPWGRTAPDSSGKGRSGVVVGSAVAVIAAIGGLALWLAGGSTSPEPAAEGAVAAASAVPVEPAASALRTEPAPPPEPSPAVAAPVIAVAPSATATPSAAPPSPARVSPARASKPSPPKAAPAPAAPAATARPAASPAKKSNVFDDR